MNRTSSTFLFQSRKGEKTSGETSKLAKHKDTKLNYNRSENKLRLSQRKNGRWEEDAVKHGQSSKISARVCDKNVDLIAAKNNQLTCQSVVKNLCMSLWTKMSTHCDKPSSTSSSALRTSSLWKVKDGRAGTQL